MTQEKASPLPEPKKPGRWQPLRSGVLNLYKYDYEEFHFEDGRLLLRGNNGTGKSRILALQLPFLLDGEVSPARVEPDGDPAKRIEWNLLMGKYQERTGYTWIEFARRDADGTCHYVTLGCGLKAVSGHTGLHSRWYFITGHRIGRDLYLQQGKAPLSRDRLTTALGSQGTVYAKPDDYRRAVDAKLFGLEGRYGPLVELLLRLRRPQLSRKLEEEELSAALSDALPTLPSTMIDEAAESFRSLQADREALDDFKVALAGIMSFLEEYTGYVRVVVSRRAAAVRKCHSSYEAAQRAVRDAENRINTATAALAELEEKFVALTVGLAGAEAHEKELRDSPEMKSAKDLQDAEKAAKDAARAHGIALEDEKRAQGDVDRATETEQKSVMAAEKIAATLQADLVNAEVAAKTTDLLDPHRHYFPTSFIQSVTEESVASASAGLKTTLGKRRQAIATLKLSEQSASTAHNAFLKAEEARQAAEGANSSAREAEATARLGLQARGRDLRTGYVDWCAGLRLLQCPEAEALDVDLATWVEVRNGESPVRQVVAAAQTAALTQLAGRDAACNSRSTELETELLECQKRIAELENGVVPVPPVPHTRRTDRAGRSGAPLWRVCDFKPELAENDRAGLEAALESSGLLDAWISPDGKLLAGSEDSFAWVELTAPAEKSSSLLSALIVSRDPADTGAAKLDEKIIQAVLAGIGLGRDKGSVWVDRSGEWRNGGVTGAWRKPTAEFIGAASRAASIRRQLEELRARQKTLQRQKAELAQAREAIVQDRALLAHEQASAPSDEPVVRAGLLLEARTKDMVDAQANLVRHTESSRQGRQISEDAAKKRDQDAADLGLSIWIGRLAELEGNQSRYENAVAGIWPTVRHMLAAVKQSREDSLRLQNFRSQHEVLRLRRVEAAVVEQSAAQRFTTLQSAHGQTTRQVLERLAKAEKAVVSLKQEIQVNQQSKTSQTGEQSRAESDRAHALTQRAEHDGQRNVAMMAMQRVAEKRLIAEAHAELKDAPTAGWSVAQAVDLARQIDRVLGDVPAEDDDWARRQDSIHGIIQELRDHLVPHGHTPETHQLDDVVLVTCLFQAKTHTMTELQAAFELELQARGRLLEAREREIIENHLLAEAAVELQKLIRAAEEWVKAANAELEARPTSSGVKFRFKWEGDTIALFQNVRPILLRKGELWTKEDRAALAAFLQGRIAAEQTAEESVSWRDALSRALDYRRWHRFVVERHQDGKWRSLTRQTYGTGSTGEKALALTLPRFAAAAAHYRSAAATAPRLIMLDEAFAGIDPTMRAQCLGVLKEFDLDFVLTSELEWGCYATVPALAIYHLTTMAGMDAVATTRWVWNGREKKMVDQPLPPVEPPATPENESAD